jgi:four helix bundle protein
MQNKDLSERLLNFAALIIKLVMKLGKTFVGRHIGNQLLHAATSTGANYEEACGAESRADFVHKMQVVLKELRESLFWLKLIDRAKLLADEILHLALSEADELVKIIAKSIITAKGRPK